MKLHSSDFVKNYPIFKSVVETCQTSYPADYQRIDGKTELLVHKLEVFRGKDVVDFGCNFGMFSMLAASHAASVVGIERDPKSYAAAVATKRAFEVLGFEFGSLSYKNAGVDCLADLKFDAMLLSLVLYHLNDREITRIAEYLTSAVDTVIIQCRPGRAQAYSQGRLPDYVSAGSLYNGLYCEVDNESFLRDCGFRRIETFPLDSKYYGEDFPILVGQKHAD